MQELNEKYRHIPLVGVPRDVLDSSCRVQSGRERVLCDDALDLGI